MTIVLLNTTPIVEKLVDRLAQKRGDTLSENASEDGRPADVVIVDDSVRAQYDAKTAATLGRYTLFIGSRFDTMPEGFDALLAKPFLPDELNTALDDAEIAVSASVERRDIFDADEAASSWQADAFVEEERAVFGRAEIDEVKQLLDAVEADDEQVETLERQIETALETLDEEAWEQPIEEVLYDADAPKNAPSAKEEMPFADLDLHARGVEALQDLMAILSDESVAMALKTMGVRIDISFGEKA